VRANYGETLGYTICYCTEATSKACGRPNEHDCAFPLLDHVRHGGASQVQHCVNVDVECPIPAFFGYVKESTRRRRAYGVYKNIDSPQRAHVSATARVQPSTLPMSAWM
jgi:hypothetical protein